MRVWIDQEECTGSGLCEAIEPDMFVMGADGLAAVLDADTDLPATGAVTVRPECEREVLDASRACPGRCIRIEDD